jgi:hypothetical protein
MHPTLTLFCTFPSCHKTHTRTPHIMPCGTCNFTCMALLFQHQRGKNMCSGTKKTTFLGIKVFVSDITIRGTQIKEENHPASLVNENNLRRGNILARHMSQSAHLPTSSKASLRGVSEHFRFARGLSSGSRTTGQPTTPSPPRPSLGNIIIRLRLARDLPLTPPSPIGALENPCDITHVLASAQPDRPGMTEVKSPRHRLQQV